MIWSPKETSDYATLHNNTFLYSLSQVIVKKQKQKQNILPACPTFNNTANDKTLWCLIT